jgi:hypothetical protein
MLQQIDDDMIKIPAKEEIRHYMEAIGCHHPRVN